jgi:hypothetical protein
MLLRHLLEIPTCMTGGMVGILFKGATRHALSSLVSAFGLRAMIYS